MNWPGLTCSSTVAISEPVLQYNQVLKVNALILVHNHPAFGHVSLLEVLLHFACSDHLWLDINNPLHDLLVFSINSLCLPLLSHVVQ